MHREIEIANTSLIIHHIFATEDIFSNRIQITLCGIISPTYFILFYEDLNTNGIKKYSKSTWMCKKCIEKLK